MDIRELRGKRASLVAEARSILDLADKEAREMSAEERQKYDKIMTDVDAMKGRIDLEERQAELEREAAASLGTKAAKQEGNDKRDIGPRESDEYRNAFWKAVRHTRNSLDAPEVRALQVGTDTEGGFLVPTEFERRLIQALETQDVLRSLATVVTTSSDRSVPVVTSHGSAVWLAEESPVTESDESFGLKTLYAHKLGTLIKVSEELLQDSAFGLEAYLANEFARRIGAAEETAFATGNGVGKPLGFVADAEIGVTAASATAITSDELLDLFHALKRPYRPRANWLMADATAKAIRKLKDSTNQYIWQPGLQAGQPDTLLSRPVTISDDIPAMATGNKSILFGDFSYYWIADRQGRVFQRLNELYAINGQVGFRAYQRVDGKLTLAEAIKALKQA